MLILVFNEDKLKYIVVCNARYYIFYIHLSQIIVRNEDRKHKSTDAQGYFRILHFVGTIKKGTLPFRDHRGSKKGKVDRCRRNIVPIIDTTEECKVSGI